MCSSDYRMCGMQTGEAYKTLTGFSVMNIAITDEMLQYSDTNIPEFVRGMLDGLNDDNLKAMDAEL